MKVSRCEHCRDRLASLAGHAVETLDSHRQHLASAILIFWAHPDGDPELIYVHSEVLGNRMIDPRDIGDMLTQGIEEFTAQGMQMITRSAEHKRKNG